MNFRLAVMQDLPQMKEIYSSLIQNMNENRIPIWDDIYPCEFFEEDIINKRLYLMLDNTEILSAFALCESSSGENAVEWKDCSGKALYLDRFGVWVQNIFAFLSWISMHPLFIFIPKTGLRA